VGLRPRAKVFDLSGSADADVLHKLRTRCKRTPQVCSKCGRNAFCCERFIGLTCSDFFVFVSAAAVYVIAGLCIAHPFTAEYRPLAPIAPLVLLVAWWRRPRGYLRKVSTASAAGSVEIVSLDWYIRYRGLPTRAGVFSHPLDPAAPMMGSVVSARTVRNDNV
jgi:hypothetical protein